MKSYFILRDFLLDSLNSVSSGIALKSWKISGVETLPNQFFVDNQVASTNPQQAFMFCKCNPDGSQPLATLNSPNSFNPFAKCFGLNFNTQNGLYRGQPIGTFSGNDYGAGIMTLGVDKPGVMTLNAFLNGAFFIDIDYTRDLYVEFDIITNVVGAVVYEEPKVLRKYKIIWEQKRCYREFSYYSYQTNQSYNDGGLGFLAGITQEDFSQTPFVDFSGIVCGDMTGGCINKERTRSYALFVNIPTEGQAPEVAFKECCYTHKVFADLTDSADFRNDYSAFYHQRQISTETAAFFLYDFSDSSETPLTSTSYGELFNFGSFASNPNLKAYRVDWRKVLQTKGSGSYKIIKRQVIAGITVETSSFVFTLAPFSSTLADHTVRIDYIMNGLLIDSGVDFTDTFFRDSIRVPGFFGRREPQFVEDNLIDRNYRSEQISMTQSNEYKFQTNNIPDCVKEQIIDFALFANDLFMNDYNLNNSSYKYVRYPVRFANNEGTDYGAHKRKSKLNLVFKDKYENRRKTNY